MSAPDDSNWPAVLLAIALGAAVVMLVLAASIAWGPTS